MSEKYWITYRSSVVGQSSIANRTGFIDSIEDAFEVASDLASIDHVHDVVVEEIVSLARVKD